jgi:hypothetical protein
VINYRGITVLPVINKIIETIIKNRTSHKILAIQNPIQRGFTKGSPPLNSALPVEETYRENADNKNECQLVLLDAKSAFDVVIQSSDETGIPCWNTGQTLVTIINNIILYVLFPLYVFVSAAGQYNVIWTGTGLPRFQFGSGTLPALLF